MSDRSWFRINRDLLVYKAFYFFFLSGFGSIFPYLPVYFRQIGLPASQVGLLLGLRPIVQLASAPFWAIMADKYRKRKSVLVMSVMSWLIMTMALAFVEPTNEICEIRRGNNTHSLVYNYTKVKTGFFRRTLLWHKADVGEETEDVQHPGIDIVPIYIDGERKRHFKSVSSSNIKPHSAVTLPQLNHTKFEITNQPRAFYPSKVTDFSQKPDKKHRTVPDQEGNRLSLNTLSSERNLSALLNFINNTQQYGEYSKQGPALKARTNNTLQTTTSRMVVPTTQQINRSNHLSRFHKFNNSPGQNKRWKHFSNSGNLGKPKNEGTKLRQTDTANLTSNFVSPAKHSEEKNDDSSIDKRRQNKRVPPVVIEFSRIVIPDSKDSSANDNSDDIHDYLKGLKKENTTNYVHAHKTAFHLSQPASEQENDSISEPLVSKAGLLPHVNNSKYKDYQTGFKPISKGLLQLEEKLSKLVEFDSKSTLTVNTPLDASKGDMHKLHINNTAVDKSGFSNQSLTRTFQIHIRNKNISKEIDKLHQGESQKLEAEFLLHRMKPAFDISADPTNNTNGLNVKPLNDSNSTSEHLPLNNSLRSSGTTLLKPLWQQNVKSGNVTSGGAQKGKPKYNELEDNESTFQTIQNFTRSNVSGSYQESYTKTGQSYLLQNLNGGNTQLLGNYESDQKIWMTNLLKTNSFELKRIFTILLVLVVVGEFLEAPSTTLADASLLEHLGEERRYYGKQRLWGSLGFGLSSFLVGVLLERSRHVVCGDQYTDYMICFCVFALLMVMTLFISTTFKFQYKETDAKSASVLSALCNVHYGSCLAAACFMGVGHGMSHSFLNWFLEDLGATKTLMGVAVICRSTLDLLTFFAAGSLIKAIGQIKIMICALISYGIAFTLYSLLTNPWWVLPIEMLVGCTYAASWSACTSYMAGASSSESVTTIQGNKRTTHIPSLKHLVTIVANCRCRI